jgi:hypothetical protein
MRTDTRVNKIGIYNYKRQCMAAAPSAAKVLTRVIVPKAEKKSSSLVSRLEEARKRERV